MPQPLVSIVVSAYNRPELLRGALSSAVSQTYGNLEILVQDDSTDGACHAVAEAFADPRIRYTRNVPSLGTAGNLIAGYRKATGAYFCTLNDDDLYAPEYVETLAAALVADPSAALAFCDHFIIDDDGIVSNDATERNTRKWARDALAHGRVANPLDVALVAKSIPAMFAMFRKDAIALDDFPAAVSSGYDYWLAYLAVREGRPIYYIKQRLTFYREHAQSQTASFDDPEQRLRFARYTQFTHERFLADARLASVHAQLAPRLAEAHNAAGFALVKTSRQGEAMHEFTRSLRVRPTLRAIIGLVACAVPPFILNAIAGRSRASS
jgi:glycosyltransferase involved in cell wall biosynthesis